MTTDLSRLILARLHSKGDRVIRMRGLLDLSDRVGYHGKSRHIDQTLQRMRRSGLIRYDSKAGWTVVDDDAERLEAGKRDGRYAVDSWPSESDSVTHQNDYLGSGQ